MVSGSKLTDESKKPRTSRMRSWCCPVNGPAPRSASIARSTRQAPFPRAFAAVALSARPHARASVAEHYGQRAPLRLARIDRGTRATPTRAPLDARWLSALWRLRSVCAGWVTQEQWVQAQGVLIEAQKLFEEKNDVGAAVHLRK